MYEMSREKAIIISILKERSGIQILEVIFNNDHRGKAINYTALSGHLTTGDHVYLNTTAVRLNLGTGGFHFVINKIERDNDTVKKKEGFRRDELNKNDGHIIKMRYTPFQIRTMALAEKNGQFHEELKSFIPLDNMVVVFLPLHSMLAPLLLIYNYFEPSGKTLFIMTEGGSLPASWSESIAELKKRNLLDIVITAGNSFGGDYEAVNIFTALTAAKLLKAEMVIVGIGPGHVGTGTVLGFSGAELALSCHAVELLGGRSVFVPRISFTEKRERHNPVSHHTLIMLKKLLGPNVETVFPDITVLRDVIKKENIYSEKILFYRTEKVESILSKSDYNFKSMGRNFDQDPWFFITPGLAAVRVLEIKKE